MTTLKNWGAMLIAAALVLTVSACGDKTETTDGGATPVAVVDGPVGTYKGVITDEMRAEIAAQLETAPEEMQAGMQAEVDRIYASIEGMQIELKSDSTFLMEAGTEGSVEGTWTHEGEVITITATRVSDGDGEWREASEVETAPQPVYWNEEEETLKMGPSGAELTLKRV